ncbi:hypothetical protein GCM10023189_38460 [Nibrella saemangeumensis]|uniref:Fibronectin type-III domain-containing protein n=1 Tax=Nibrella saemangeumensis TaxID=1084526 RepID=A0ABP8NAR2_9BACT
MKPVASFLLTTLLLTLIWGCNEDFTVEPVGHGMVTGQVIDKKTGRPVSKAVVRLSPLGRIARTDTTGHFRMDTIAAGKYTVQATKEGYQDRSETVEIIKRMAATTLLYLSYNDRPPTEPTAMNPTGEASTAPTTVTLKWQSTDPDKDPLSYDITLIREGSPDAPQVFTAVKADSLVVKGLRYGSTYTWQVKVSDGSNEVYSKIWRFCTMAFPDLAYVYAKKVNDRYQIFTANDTGVEIQLTHKGSNWRPVASPDRKRIAFISNSQTDLHIFLMNRDGSDLHRVTSTPIAGLMPLDLSFCWSPDGTQLLYPSNNRLFAVNTDGNGLRQVAELSTGAFFAGCDWTSQGNRIAARLTGYSVYNSRIMLMSPGGNDTTTVFVRNSNRISNPVFSVDGTKLLFATDFAALQDWQGRQLDSQILLYDIAKKTTTNLSASKTSSTSYKEEGTNDLDPRFSPNGAKIIFTNADNHDANKCAIMTMDADGKNRKALVQQAEMPCWK